LPQSRPDPARAVAPDDVVRRGVDRTRRPAWDHRRTKVAVLGAGGRMGSQSCQAIEAAEDLEPAARVSRGDPLETLTDNGTEVVVDFTRPDVVMDNLRWCVEHGIHAVVGTSGFDEERLARVRSWLADAPGVGVLVVPNFSIGAVLMM